MSKRERERERVDRRRPHDGKRRPRYSNFHAPRFRTGNNNWNYAMRLGYRRRTSSIIKEAAVNRGLWRIASRVAIIVRSIACVFLRGFLRGDEKEGEGEGGRKDGSYA